MEPVRPLAEPPNSGVVVAQSVLVEMTLPKDWASFHLPPALDDRLQELLDRQDREGNLSRRERREARALTELVDILSLLKARAHQSGAKTGS